MSLLDKVYDSLNKEFHKRAQYDDNSEREAALEQLRDMIRDFVVGFFPEKETDNVMNYLEENYGLEWFASTFEYKGQLTLHPNDPEASFATDIVLDEEELLKAIGEYSEREE